MHSQIVMSDCHFRDHPTSEQVSQQLQQAVKKRASAAYVDFFEHLFISRAQNNEVRIILRHSLFIALSVIILLLYCSSLCGPGKISVSNNVTLELEQARTLTRSSAQMGAGVAQLVKP